MAAISSILTDERCLNSQERAQAQTNDEWLREYATGQPVIPQQREATLYKPWKRDKPTKITRVEPERLLSYDTHRTTRKGHLVLVFLEVRTQEEVVAFFNVDTKRQRGKDKGLPHKSGHKGKFYPLPRSKFRAFFLAATGKAPPRWAMAYKFLSPWLKGRLFTGNVTTEIKQDRSGNVMPYLKVSDVTIWKHPVDMVVTS